MQQDKLMQDMLFQLEQYVSLLRQYEQKRFLAIDPREQVALDVEIKRLESDISKLEERITAREKGVDHRPTGPEALMGQARAAMLAGDFNGALDVVDQVRHTYGSVPGLRQLEEEINNAKQGDKVLQQVQRRGTSPLNLVLRGFSALVVLVIAAVVVIVVLGTQGANDLDGPVFSNVGACVASSGGSNQVIFQAKVVTTKPAIGVKSALLRYGFGNQINDDIALSRLGNTDNWSAVFETGGNLPRTLTYEISATSNRNITSKTKQETIQLGNCR